MSSNRHLSAIDIFFFSYREEAHVLREFLSLAMLPAPVRATDVVFFFEVQLNSSNYIHIQDCVLYG
jgi:hypothetical protein